MKQKLFIESYLISFNATEAAKKAGYSNKTAYQIGYENLRKPEIREVLENWVRGHFVSNDLLKTRLTMELAGVAFAKPSAFGIQPKLKALEILTKLLGSLPEEVEDNKMYDRKEIRKLVNDRIMQYKRS